MNIINIKNMTIDELAIKHNTDKSSLDHNYTQFYQSYFDKFIKTPKKILELGIYSTVAPPTINTCGASLKTWAEYYPEATIYGLDLVDFSVLDEHYGNIKTMCCNCEIRTHNDFDHYQNITLKNIHSNMVGGKIGLNQVINNFGGDFDIIIDDGPHTMASQQIFLGYMFPYLKSGGIFVIEDLHTSRAGGVYNDPYTDKNTLWVFENYVNNNEIKSDFMTSDEIHYLNDNIKNLYIEKGKNSEITFIIKK
jgi:hypothetical protein